jgi:hypothetical protein
MHQKSKQLIKQMNNHNIYFQVVQPIQVKNK